MSIKNYITGMKLKLWLVSHLIDWVVPYDRLFRWKVYHESDDGKTAGVERLNDRQLIKALFNDDWHYEYRYEIGTVLFEPPSESKETR